VEEHVSRNLTDGFWLSAAAYYNVCAETSINGMPQDKAASTLRVGGGMGSLLWRGADLGLTRARHRQALRRTGFSNNTPHSRCARVCGTPSRPPPYRPVQHPLGSSVARCRSVYARDLPRTPRHRHHLPGIKNSKSESYAEIAKDSWRTRLPNCVAYLRDR
jgi:hypothetical protein